jgi:hypothetical protein
MKGVLLAVLVSVGSIIAWCDAADADPVRSRRGVYAEREYDRDRDFRRPDRIYRDRRYRERRIGRIRDYDGPRYSERYRRYDRPRYTSRRRIYEERRYSRATPRFYDGPRYSRVSGPGYFSPAPGALYSPPVLRVPIYPNGELPGAYGWRDRYDPVGPFVNPANVELFFQRNQERAN